MSYSLNEHVIVATDLDGTLLDHHTYSWEAARPSLDLLHVRSIPVILNTSKTFAEVKELKSELGLDAAFIVENGSAIYIPRSVHFSDQFEGYDQHYTRKVFGIDRAFVTRTLQSLREKYNYTFECYSDWNIKDVVQHTGLSEESAQKSLDRQFSEPLIWRDSEHQFEAFKREIDVIGLRMIRGGRFIHILGQSNKGSALIELKNTLYPNGNCSLICLGDSHNDLDMLNIADIPIFVRSPVHDFPEHNCQHSPIYTEGFGPVGWHEAIQRIFI